VAFSWAQLLSLPHQLLSMMTMSLSVHMFMDIVSEILLPSLKDVHCGGFLPKV
jgi:hypothetical protein